MKRTIALFLALLCVLGLSAGLPAHAAGFKPDFDITSPSVFLISEDSGVVMYERDARTPRSVASLTKLMTALLLIENTPDLANTEFFAEPTLFDELYGQGGSTADIRPYENVTGLSLLYAMMLPSANEAASIAAYQLGGGVMENFYAMMNERARQLGCENTHFSSPNGMKGIDEDNYSCAYDIYLIARECMKHEIFRTVVTSDSYGMPFTNKHTTPEFASRPDEAYMILNTNLMQRSKTAGIHRSYIRGIKTGSTPEAGRCFASSAVQDGETFFCVVLGAPYEAVDDEGYALSFTDTANLYDWAFNDFTLKPALDTESPLAEVKVLYSYETDSVMVYPAGGASTILPNNSEEENNPVTLEFTLPDSIAAPVKRGDAVGSVTVYVDGERVSTVELLAAQDVERSWPLFIFTKITGFFTGTFFKVLVVLSLITAAGYAALYFWVVRKDKQQRAQRKAQAQARREAAQHGAAAPARKPAQAEKAINSRIVLQMPHSAPREDKSMESDITVPIPRRAPRTGSAGSEASPPRSSAHTEAFSRQRAQRQGADAQAGRQNTASANPRAAQPPRRK